MDRRQLLAEIAEAAAPYPLWPFAHLRREGGAHVARWYEYGGGSDSTGSDKTEIRYIFMRAPLAAPTDQTQLYMALITGPRTYRWSCVVHDGVVHCPNPAITPFLARLWRQYGCADD